MVKRYETTSTRNYVIPQACGGIIICMAFLRILQIQIEYSSRLTCISEMIELTAIMFQQPVRKAPDLDSCDFCLCGYLKIAVCSSPIANITELKIFPAQRIHNAKPNTFLSVAQPVVSQFLLVARNSGNI